MTKRAKEIQVKKGVGEGEETKIAGNFHDWRRDEVRHRL